MLRKLIRADLPQIQEIEQAVQGAPWNQKAFLTCFEFGCTGWVSEQQGKITAYILISQCEDECHILNFGVAREHQRQGLGTMLLNHVLDLAIRDQVNIAYLEVRRSNKGALALYRKMRFQVVGERKDYYTTVNGKEDALVLAVDLRSWRQSGERNGGNHLLDSNNEN